MHTRMDFQVRGWSGIAEEEGGRVNELGRSERPSKTLRDLVPAINQGTDLD